MSSSNNTPKFTEEQRTAINFSGNRLSAAVSASAGSGKTAVLVEHIAKLISDKEHPVPADKIAAVTFTEKAAAELKSRLEKRMERLIEEHPNDEFYFDQSVRLSFAQISTISSFCLSIIKDNIRLLPLEEGISVIDEVKVNALSEKAAKLTLKKLYTDFSHDEQRKYFRILGGERDLVSAAKQMYRFFSNLPDPQDWINNQLDIYGSPKLFENNYIIPYKMEIIDSVNIAVNTLKDAIAEIRAFIVSEKPFKKPTGRELNLEEQTSNLSLKAAPYFENLQSIIQKAFDAFQNDDYDSALTEISQKQGTSPPIGGNPNLAKFVTVKDKVKDSIEDFKTALSVLVNPDQDRQKCFDVLNCLYTLEKMYEKEFSELKRKEKGVDFSDLERYALKTVTDKNANIKGKYEYIIVDEFQDSNDIQYEIFKALSKDEKNLFFVGDEKQCIYAFRNANPDIFTSLCLDPKNKNRYKNIKLTKNFRSSENVINTVNLLFRTENKPKSFSENPWEDMSCGRGIPACEKNKSELVKVYDNSNVGDRELIYAASRIQQMVSEGFTIHEGEKERPCRYGDFAILTRRNDTVIRLRKIMGEYGIPAVSLGERDFTNLLEVEQVMAVLAAVIRPNDNISVTKALMCPVYRFTADDMARIRLGDGTEIIKPDKTTLYYNLSQMDNAGEKDALHQKISRFLSDMKLLRKEASRCNTSQLIRKIYGVTALDQVMSVGAKGKERLANMRLLVRYGRDYPHPADFLAAMRKIKSSDIAMPQAQVKEQEEKSVKLMSIHASKGLQFPVVFLAETNTSPNTRDRFDKYIFNAKKGAGITVSDNERMYKYQTLSHKLLEKDYLDKVLGEELRLLYVAMTRAEEKLIVTASVSLKTDTKGKETESSPTANSYYEFISCGLKVYPAMMEQREVEEGQEIILTAEQTAQSENTANFDLIKEKLSYKYPYQKLSQTPAKFTATELGVIADEGNADENTASRAFYLGLPLFIKKNKPLTPKERGDLYHKVMENLNFSAQSAAEELNRLTNSGIVTQKERLEIKTEEIQGFLNSPLCGRANKAEEINREFPVFTTVNAANTENPSPEDLSFIQGIADMYFVEKGEIVLVDYKTNRNTTARKLTDEYKGQLEIYKKALEEMTGLKVKECWIYSFTLGQCVKV